ncbi:hypothetical protein L226DRAFT_609582 [Lentinus tigrinus ALCF2SS1-7]|uniref:Uncharacterized protein n=1 Tax=Lentinus tigrinus ALCF2SS1-6 TaxID=1328759 RepID=A0A5C2SP25_9APHY|nr:hypothetical protein L227DRAFT_649639 [Lentinus tigrinus ALCF2SS1-6]RPD78999.1 hypothetical protein L226DRAFT_609582 [Lentinus tigrinus ALCF2SS1-7]
MAIFKARNRHANYSLFADLRFPTNLRGKDTSTPKPRSPSAPTTATTPLPRVSDCAPSCSDTPRRDAHAHTQLLGTTSLASAPTVSLALVSLPFAQCRKDIRWRKEGFEMASSDPDAVPFAIRTHTLVPLDTAYERDDIRRRNEAFESRSLSVNSNDQRVSPPASPTVRPPSPPCPTIHNYQSALPSVYSRYSWNDEVTKEEEDTVTAVYEVYRGLTLFELGYGVASDEAVMGAASVSFDEESFLRMAEDSLGW